jgi:ubiquinone biosynthesis protein UbiJ
MSRSVPALLLALAERSLRKVMHGDELAEARVRALEGRILALHFEGPDYRVFAQARDGAIVLGGPGAEAPDVTISGTLGEFIASRKRGAGDARVFGQLDVRGDAASAQAWQELLSGLGIDWEEWLSDLVGDVAAHQIARAARGLSGWLAATGRTLEQDLSEYLRYEAEIVATREQLEAHYREVTALTGDVDRAEARLERLHRHFEHAR